MSGPDPGWRSWYMTRRGCRRIASIAAKALVIGSRSAGFSPSGCRVVVAGWPILGGMAPGLGFMSFMIAEWFSIEGQKADERLEHSFIKISVKSGFAEELDWQTG